MREPNHWTGLLQSHQRDVTMACLCAGLVAAIIALAVAVAPFYGWLCRSAAFGVAPRAQAAAPTQSGGNERIAKVAPGFG